jgi:hypothetical protein
MRTPLLVLILAGCTAGNDVMSEADLLAPGVSFQSSQSWIAQSQEVDILVDVLSGEADPNAPASPNLLRIQAFDLEIVTELQRIDQGGDPAWVGTVVDDPLGEVVFSASDTALAGTVQAHGRLFTLGSDESGSPILTELNADAMPADGVPVSVPVSPDAPQTQADGSGTVDMLVVYTAAASLAVGGESAMDALIGVAIAETNQGYVNSGVSHRVALVGTEEVAYSEAGFHWETALGRLSGTSDGYLDEVHALRDSVGADQVTLIVNQSQYCGLAYLMSSPSASFAGSAFSLVYHGCATGYYSFGHELGHNMGSTHDHNNGSGGEFPQSYGYQAPNRAFRTVMAYNCPSGGCARVNYWSNPSVSYASQPTGIAGSGSDAANNASSLGQTAAIVGGFREGSGGESVAATVSSPTPSSVLNSSTLTVSWLSAGADGYSVSAGDSPGSSRYDTALSLPSNATQAQLTGLPDNGSTVHVRLWSSFDGDWLFTDVQYSAVDVGEATPAELTSPSNGSTLASDALTLSWTDVGARQYQVFIGRYPGDRSMVDTATTQTSMTVNDLPRDSRPLYIRLFSNTASGWLYTDRAITATGPAAPSATTVHTPSPGAALSEGTVDFEWDDVGADEYHLFVGYRIGSREVFSSSAGVADSIEVGGLPLESDGLHVRLWTRAGTDWNFTDAAYTAAENAAAVPVDITSPSPASSVPGGTVTVSWTDEGADEYAVFAGLAQGNRELFDTNAGTVTSVTVTNLPTTDRTFWIRVWARFGDEWTFTDATYTGTL